MHIKDAEEKQKSGTISHFRRFATDTNIWFGYSAHLIKQKSPCSIHLALADFELDAMAARAAGADLLLQLGQLHAAGLGHAMLLQPMPQHIALPRGAKLLQGLDTGRQTHGLQIGRSHFLQQALRLRAVRSRTRKSAAEAGKSRI